MDNFCNDVGDLEGDIFKGSFNFKGRLFYSLCPIFVVDKDDTYHEGIIYGAKTKKESIASSIFLSTKKGILELKEQDIKLIVKVK